MWKIRVHTRDYQKGFLLSLIFKTKKKRLPMQWKKMWLGDLTVTVLLNKQENNMKITTTITAKEKNDTLNAIKFDPCTYINCGEIHCDDCPLQDVAEALRRAQEDYERVINKIEIESE